MVPRNISSLQKALMITEKSFVISAFLLLGEKNFCRVKPPLATEWFCDGSDKDGRIKFCACAYSGRENTRRGAADVNYAQEKQTRPHGLDGEAVARSRREHGENVMTKKKERSFFLQFLSNLGDPVIRILLGALAVHLVLVFQNGDWIETAGIAVAVFLAALISTLSEYSSARAFERLSADDGGAEFRVWRDGIIRATKIGEIVVGDRVMLSAGEQIPADGRLISGKLSVDQSAMTGEGKEVKKNAVGTYQNTPDSPLALFRGCTVTAGEGEMEVLAVGDGTLLGRISREIQEEKCESPLKARLSRLARQISVIGYAAAVLVALAYLFNVFFLDSGMQRELILLKLSDVRYLFSQLFHAFTLGLTVLVVAVPEGLPMMIAVVLSANMRRMVRDRVLVRRPMGLEAAGSMNLLFTDKTGTLTEGKMRLGEVLSAAGANAPRELFTGGGSLARAWMLALRFGTDATVGTDGKGKRVALGGNATSRALLSAVLSYPELRGVTVTSTLPFDSTRKYAAVTLREGRRMTVVIGAPERIFPYVTGQMGTEGERLPFDRKRAEEEISARTSAGARVLCVALMEEAPPAASLEGGLFGNAVYLGTAVLFDPLRKSAKRSVAALHGAGIGVVMITGDGKETAASIAEGCGILNAQRHRIVTGEELSRMSDGEVKELLPTLCVVARALPSDKSRLVRLSREMGLVVGMTGDGINDSPALRASDVGFSMGSGTQVARDAGDVIILDDDLASVVRAVLYGRSIFKSIRKFITLQLTMNLCAVGVTMICPFLGVDSPVTVVQMLWINLIMDTLGGIAFAGEAPLPEYMKEPPKRREEPILNRYMIDQILCLGGFTVFLCLFFLKSPTVTSAFRPSGDSIYLLTAFFALFIFSSVFNCFNARTDRLWLFANLKKNPVFLLVMGAILIIQILFVYLGGSVLRTVPLTPRELIVTSLLSLSVFPAEVIRRALWRVRGNREGF